MSSPEATKELLEIIENNTTITEAKAFELFDQLEPVEIDWLLGPWTGGPVETGHKTSKWCEDLNFAGKTFTSPNDVLPVWVYNGEGVRSVYEPSGTARLREVKYRGVVTAALIYDNGPIIDAFRKIDENTLISAADNKNKPVATWGTFFFYLKRGELPQKVQVKA